MMNLTLNMYVNDTIKELYLPNLLILLFYVLKEKVYL